MENNSNSLRSVNGSFENFSKVGSRVSENVEVVESGETQTVLGVSVEQSGPKKAVTVEMLVPTHRSDLGSRKVTRIRLSGRQARQMYETLRNFYESREAVEDTTGVMWY